MAEEQIRTRAEAKTVILEVAVLILFALGFCGAMFGMFFEHANTSSFAALATITTGGIVLLMILLTPEHVLKSITIGPIKAEIAEVRAAVDAQQALIYQIVKYSLAEVIYRELLWKIGKGIVVTRNKQPDQLRWLTFLFDSGLIDPIQRSIGFEQIGEGENLCNFFKATPAAEYLMDLRREPR